MQNVNPENGIELLGAGILKPAFRNNVIGLEKGIASEDGISVQAYLWN